MSSENDAPEILKFQVGSLLGRTQLPFIILFKKRISQIYADWIVRFNKCFYWAVSFMRLGDSDICSKISFSALYYCTFFENFSCFSKGPELCTVILKVNST